MDEVRLLGTGETDEEIRTYYKRRLTGWSQGWPAIIALMKEWESDDGQFSQERSSADF